MNNSQNQKDGFLIWDAAIIALSVLVAVILVETNVIGKILTSARELKLLGSFIAGMFFTSIFTTAPSIVTLGQIAHSNSIALTAFFGAIGAVLGDLIIFRFVKDRLSEHLMELIKHEGWGKRAKALLRLKYLRWFTFFAGGLIIASPLPDELGISILGLSKIKTLWFIPISFAFNFIGIIIIGLAAKAL